MTLLKFCHPSGKSCQPRVARHPRMPQLDELKVEKIIVSFFPCFSVLFNVSMIIYLKIITVAVTAVNDNV